MGNNYFFTGFPGFIASQLIRKIIFEMRNQVDHFYLLVLPSMIDQANQEIDSIVKSTHFPKELFTIIKGDITQENLAMDQQMNEVLQGSITHIFHLAAIYDLAVPEKLAYEVNVNGTKNVNDWALTVKSLQRYVYFSTAYIAGTRKGNLLETELEHHASFKNHYEHTKYLAEILVDKLKAQLPITIIRPGIVKGHSQTGETIKFDGPYFILNFFDKLRFLPFIPYIGHGHSEINVVPIDYILDATIFLSHNECGAGKTYHLTDPNPLKVKEVYQILMEEFLGKAPKGRIPVSFARVFMAVKPIRKFLRVEKETLDYFAWEASFDCRQAQQDLASSGIRCPSFRESAKAMITFYKEHKNDQKRQISIR